MARNITDIEWQSLNVLTCNRCNLKTSDMALLQAHHCKPRKQQITADVSYNLVNEKFMCSLCTVELPETEFCEHLEGHLTLKPYVCKYCDRDFSTRGEVCEHLGSFHQQDEQIFVLKLTGKTKDIIQKAKTIGKAFYKPVNILVPISNSATVIISKTPTHNLTTVAGQKQKTMKAPVTSCSHLSPLGPTSTVYSTLPTAVSPVSLGAHPRPASQLNSNTVLTCARPQLQAEQSRYSLVLTTQSQTGSVSTTSTNVLQTQAPNCLSQNVCTTALDSCMRRPFPQKHSRQVPGTQMASTSIPSLVNNISAFSAVTSHTQKAGNHLVPTISSSLMNQPLAPAVIANTEGNSLLMSADMSVNCQSPNEIDAENNYKVSIEQFPTEVKSSVESDNVNGDFAGKGSLQINQEPSSLATEVKVQHSSAAVIKSEESTDTPLQFRIENIMSLAACKWDCQQCVQDIVTDTIASTESPLTEIESTAINHKFKTVRSSNCSFLHVVKGCFLCLVCQTKWNANYVSFFKHIWENHTHEADFSCCPTGYSPYCARLQAVVKTIYDKSPEPMSDQIRSYFTPKSSIKTESENVQNISSSESSSSAPAPSMVDTEKHVNVSESPSSIVPVRPSSAPRECEQSFPAESISRSTESSSQTTLVPNQHRHMIETEQNYDFGALTAGIELGKNAQYVQESAIQIGKQQADRENLCSVAELRDDLNFNDKNLQNITTIDLCSSEASKSVIEESNNKNVYEDISDDDRGGINYHNHGTGGITFSLADSPYSGELPLDLSKKTTQPEKSHNNVTVTPFLAAETAAMSSLTHIEKLSYERIDNSYDNFTITPLSAAETAVTSVITQNARLLTESIRTSHDNVTFTPLAATETAVNPTALTERLKTSLAANIDIDAVSQFACNMCQLECAYLDKSGLQLQESHLKAIECNHCASFSLNTLSWKKHMTVEHADLPRMDCIKRKLLCCERKMHSNVPQQSPQEDIPCLPDVERAAETSDYQCEGTRHEPHSTPGVPANVLDETETIASSVIYNSEVHSRDVELTETHSDHEGRDVADGIQAQTTHEHISKIPNILDLVKTSAVIISAVSLDAGNTEHGAVTITDPNRNERRGNNVTQQCESGTYTTTINGRRGSVDVDLHGLLRPVLSRGNNELRGIVPDLTAVASMSGNGGLLQIENSGNMEDVQPVSKTSTSVDSSNSVKSALSHAKDNLTNTLLDSEDLGHQEVVTEIPLGVQSSSHDSFDQIVSENISTLPNNMTVLLNNPCLNEKAELSVVGQAEAVSEISKPRVKHTSHSVVGNIDASLDLDQATSVESQDGCDVTSVSTSNAVSFKLPQASDCSDSSKDYFNITSTDLSLPATRVSDLASTSAANFNLSMAETRTILCVSEQNNLEYTENTCLPVEIGADIDNRQESRHSSVVLENNLKSGVQHDTEHVISNVAKVGGDQAASPALTGISETKINDLLKEPCTNNGSHCTPDVIIVLKTVSHDSGDIANPATNSLGPNHDSCHDIDFSSSKDPTCTLQESVGDFPGNDDSLENESLENESSCGHDLLHLNIDKTGSNLTQDLLTEKQETKKDGTYDEIHYNKNSLVSTKDGQLYASNEAAACIESREAREENVLNSPSHSDIFMEENNNTASVDQTSIASNITENNDRSHTETNGLSDKDSTEQDLSNSLFRCNCGTLISGFTDGDHNVQPQDKSLKISFTGKCAKCRLVTQEKSHKNSEVDPPEISTIKNNYSIFIPKTKQFVCSEKSKTNRALNSVLQTAADNGCMVLSESSYSATDFTTLEKKSRLKVDRSTSLHRDFIPYGSVSFRSAVDSHCKRKPDDEPDKANITSKILRKNSEKHKPEDTVIRLERYVAVIQSPIDIQGADTTAQVCRVTSKSSHKMAKKRKIEMYKCMKCNFTCILDPEEMNKHISSEHPSYRCEYCAATFTTLKMMHEHLKFVHPGKGPSVMDSLIAVEQIFTRADNSYNEQGADCIDMTSQTPAKRKKRSQSSLRDGAKKRTPKASSNIKLIRANGHTHLNSCDVNVTSDQQKQPLRVSKNKKTSVGVNPNRSTAARGLKTLQCKLAYSKSEGILEKNLREISPVPENEVSSVKQPTVTSKTAAISHNGDPRSATTERHLFKTTKSINIQHLDHAAFHDSQASRSKVTSTVTEERDTGVDKLISDNTMSCTFVKTCDYTHRMPPTVSLHTNKTATLGATSLLSPRSADNNTRGNKGTEYQELDQHSSVQNVCSKMRLLGPVSSQNNVRKDNSFPVTSNHIDIHFSLNSATSVQSSSTITKQELNPVDISHIAETSNRHDNVQVHETFPDRLCSETASTCMSDAMSLNHTTTTASANVIPKKQDSKHCGIWMASQLETKTAAEGDANQDFVPRDLRTAHSGNNLIMQHGSKTESKFENAPTTDMMSDMTSFNLHNFPLKCKECSRILKCVTDIEKHYNRDHPRQDVRLTERKSGFVFSNSGECLRWKYRAKPSEDSYLCRYCAFRSMTRFAVETHIRRVHPKREVRVFSLRNPNTGWHPPGSELTSKETALPQEASRNNDPAPSSYFCNVCNDVKNSEFQFRLHLASHPCYKNTTQHISERRFKCFMCEHDSHRRINIRAHIKRIHNKTVDDDVGIIANDKQRNVDSNHRLVNIKPRVVLINLFKLQPNYLHRLVLAHGTKTFDFIDC